MVEAKLDPLAQAKCTRHREMRVAVCGGTIAAVLGLWSLLLREGVLELFHPVPPMKINTSFRMRVYEYYEPAK